MKALNFSLKEGNTNIYNTGVGKDQFVVNKGEKVILHVIFFYYIGE